MQEQARQAYLSGQKALAKELSEKGQLHNIKMKDAHSRAQESIFRLRFVSLRHALIWCNTLLKFV